MVTQSFWTRGLRTAAAVGVGAVAGAAASLAAQQHTMRSLHARLDQLEEVARSHQHADLASQQHQHWELLSKAIDDPELAEVLDLYEAPVSAKQRRQYLFANALYTNLLFYYRIGNLSKEEFFKHVRGIFQNRSSGSTGMPPSSSGRALRTPTRRNWASSWTICSSN
ncbi:hypothetical protein QF027_007083 [Streptomyces canus]|nr:hypothetical protein [Streptomyces canus]